MKTFFDSNPEAGAGTASRKQALEDVGNNINWLSRNTDSIAKWLNNL